MVTVCFTPEIFRMQRHGGVSRYVVELHRELLNQGHDSLILAGLHRNAYLDGTERVWGLDVDRLRPARVRQAMTKAVDRTLAVGASAPGGGGRILHKTYCEGRPRVARGTPVAVTVYDMIHERYPEQSGSRDRSALWKRWWCEVADVVFTISQHTKDDLVDHLRVDPSKVVVTPLGVTTAEPARLDLPVGKPFVLYVGARRPAYKNWRLLLEVVRDLGPRGQLVCFGPPPEADDLASIDQVGVRDRVHFVAGGDGRLASCYTQAAVLAYPSQHEGFGLPPLEAMAYGCPVVASRAGAIPETVGEAGLLVPPGDTDALTGALASVLEDDALSCRLRAAGRRRAAAFTWEATTAATVAGYEEICR